jgi:outer membrane protein TolC
MRCGRFIPCLVLFFRAFAVSASAGDDSLLTLSQALAEAARANSRLPVAASEILIAKEGEREARAKRAMTVAVESDAVYAPTSGYDPILTNSGEVRLQAVARQALMDGGARKAEVARSRAKLTRVRAASRMAEKDLEFEVASRYAEILSGDDEARTRREGLDRLGRYLTMLEARRHSGEAIGADILKTRVRRDAESLDLSAAERSASEARLALNDLMGREPEAPLALAGLPEPDKELGPASAEAWSLTPEAEEARARVLEASASLDATRAERHPTLLGQADTGFWESDTSHLSGFGDRFRHAAGYSLSLNLSWPIFDAGARKARGEAARLEVVQARQEEAAQMRDARRSWAQARLALASAWRDIEILRSAVGPARDAWIDAESRYRGGVASSLEVLEAYSGSVDAQIRLAEAVLRYRVAQALEKRWGTP